MNLYGRCVRCTGGGAGDEVRGGWTAEGLGRGNRGEHLLGFVRKLWNSGLVAREVGLKEAKKGQFWKCWFAFPEVDPHGIHGSQESSLG